MAKRMHTPEDLDQKVDDTEDTDFMSSNAENLDDEDTDLGNKNPGHNEQSGGNKSSQTNPKKK